MIQNLKFPSVLRQPPGNFKFKPALGTINLLELPLIPKFASEGAAIVGELRNRSTSPCG